MTRKLILVWADSETGEVMNLDGSSSSVIVPKEPVAYMIWSPFSGPAQFTTDKSAPVRTAQRADYTCTPLYTVSRADLSGAAVKLPDVTELVYELREARRRLNNLGVTSLSLSDCLRRYDGAQTTATMPKGE